MNSNATLDFILTSSDLLNADLLDPRTHAPVFRVSSAPRGKPGWSSDTTVIETFRSGTPQPQVQSRAQQAYAASPYALSPSPSAISPSPYAANGPANGGGLLMPQPHPQPTPTRSRPHSAASAVQSDSNSKVPVKTCEIEWHSVSETLIRWSDSRGTVDASKILGTSGMWDRKRKFTAKSGRTYFLRDDGSVQSESKVSLGALVTSKDDLRTKWAAQSPSAPRWAAYISFNATAVPMNDVGDLVAAMVYVQGKLKTKEEMKKAVAEGVGSGIGGAAGGGS